MISNDPFMAVFGSSSDDGSGLDRLPWIASFAVKQGFAVVVIEPGGKKPMCTLTARQVNQADREAREAAAEAGDRHADRRRHACGINHALTDPAKALAVVKRMIATHGHVNIGVELGRSRMIVVDVDTEAEKAAFQRDLQWFGSDSATGEPTVLSPGKRNADGVWTHSGGGHYWFRPPDDWEPGGSGVCKVTNETGSYTILWSDRQVLVPPSVRPEGPYRLTAPPMALPSWLAGKIAGSIAAHEERRQRTFDRLTGGDASSIDVWSAGRPWDELLLPDGWTPTGLLDSCSCPTWTRPGDWSNPKSATAHEPGCTVYDTDLGSGPLHVWTDSPPEYLVGSGGTLTKVQYIAARYHGGNLAAALAELGISQDGGPPMDLEFEAAHVAPSQKAALSGVEGPEDDECPFLAAGAQIPMERPAGAPVADEDTEAEAARIEAEEADGIGDVLERPAAGEPDWDVEKLKMRNRKIFEVADNIRIQREARALVDAEMGGSADDQELLARIKPGGAFVHDIPEGIPALWGTGQRVAWAVGEALIIVGPPGVGKTTIAHQVLCAMLTGGGEVLGIEVPELEPGGKILYLACDRPQQIARAMRRLFATVDRDVLDERFVVWQGPPLADFAQDQSMMTRMCKLVGANVVIVDSLKDVAIGLSEDSVGAGLNNSRQRALAEGIHVLELHHMTKHGPHGQAPTTLADVYGSAWITAGAGSVLLIWGEAGDTDVSIRQLKQPGETIGPLTAHHDHEAGTTTTDPFSAVEESAGSRRGRPAKQREELTKMMEAAGDWGYTRELFIEKAEEFGVGITTAKRAWQLMLDKDQIDVVIDKKTGAIKSGRYRWIVGNQQSD
jgi:replicative DNA helicase